jgi:hypothetical protein
VLKRVFGRKTEKIIEDWRKLLNEKLYNLNCLPNIIRMKSRRMVWTGHEPRMGEKKCL